MVHTEKKHIDHDDPDIPKVPLLFPSTEESLVSPIDRRSDYYRQQARHIHPSHPPPQPLLTIPNILTFFRLVLVPVLIVVWYSNIQYHAGVCGIIFILAAVTDWLDGYLARKLKIVTVFGAFLDPVADKIMVSTALVLLTTSPPPPLSVPQLTVPVIMIICREVTMSALREWAASSGGAAHQAVKVNSLGKWKTALQMVAMSSLLMCRESLDLPGGQPTLHGICLVSYVMLWGGALLGVWSLAIYMANVWTHFVNPQAKKHA